jgi:hypothetical protein
MSETFPSNNQEIEAGAYEQNIDVLHGEQDPELVAALEAAINQHEKEVE